MMNILKSIYRLVWDIEIIPGDYHIWFARAIPFFGRISCCHTRDSNHHFGIVCIGLCYQNGLLKFERF